MTDDNKNVFIAIVLSVLVIFGWSYFYAWPQMERQRQAQLQAQSQTPAQTPPGAAPKAVTPAPAGAPGQQETPPVPGQPGATVSAAATTAAEAISASPRVPLETSRLLGSINLKGGRIDDVELRTYHETTDPNSPIIRLLAPSGSPEPFFAETGFVPAPGASVALPAGDTLWTADGSKLTPSTPVTLSWDNGQGLVFHRTISVDDQYMFTVKDAVENKGSAPVALFPYALVSRHGRPQTSNYAVLHEGLIGDIGEAGEKDVKYDAIEKEAGNTIAVNGTGGWIGITDKYWAAVIAPDQTKPVDAQFRVFGAAQPKTYQTTVRDANALKIEAGQSAEATTHVFAGAKETNTLNKYEKEYNIRKFGNIIDWGWFYFFTKPLFQVLDYFYKLTGNFGVAILIVTVLIKLVFFPLANRSYASMAKMKALQPQMTAIRERFADDKQKQQEATMELYRREKVNPVAGCLPMLIQIPVFFALYKVIFITIEMRHAPFFGWIRDLSAPDPLTPFNLFGLLPFDPPGFLHIGVWPLIMGVSMFLQMKMNPEPPDPVQKTMFSWMPVIFTFTLGSFPSGLVIYWTWNNLLSVTQQYVIMRRAGAKVELWSNLASTFGRRRA